MKKKELLKIPVQDLTLTKGKKTDVDYIVQAFTSAIKRHTYLVTTFYDSQNGTPAFRFFSDKKDFVSYFYREQKWSDSMLNKQLYERSMWVYELNKYVHYRAKTLNYDTPASFSCGSRFYKGRRGIIPVEDTIQILDKFQQSVRKRQAEQRHQRKRKAIDKQMSQARPLPPTIQSWIDRIPLGKSRYIYYRRKGRKISGYCTACKADIVLTAAKHNQPGKCPNCHSEVIFKAEGISTRVFDDAYFDYVQRVKDGIMVRTFYVFKKYFEHYRDPDYTYFEETRRILEKGKPMTCFIRNNNIEWLNEWKPYTLPFLRFANLYTPSLSHVLKGTLWQYSAIDLYARHAKKFSSAYYLKKYRDSPCLEYLVKLRLFHLLDTDQGILNERWVKSVNYSGKTLKEVLGVPPGMIPFLQKIDVSTLELQILQTAAENRRKVTEDDLLWIRENLSDVDDLAYVMKYMNVGKAIRYLEKQMQKACKEISYG